MRATRRRARAALEPQDRPLLDLHLGLVVLSGGPPLTRTQRAAVALGPIAAAPHAYSPIPGTMAELKQKSLAQTSPKS
jgi:hypothetical protein